MNVISLLIEGVKKVFNGDWCKHISLFCITGLLSAGYLILERANEASGGGANEQWILGGLVLLCSGAYLCGYVFSFMHNSFGEDETEEVPVKEKDVMPDITFEHFGVFFGALLFIIYWVVMFGFAAGLVVFLTSLFVTFTHAVWVGVIVVLALTLAGVFIPFVYIAYSKHFSPSGLCNLGLPFVYMRYAFWNVFLLWLVYLVLYVAYGFLLFIIGMLLGFTGLDSSVFAYIGGLIGGYCAYLFSLIWNYCCVGIYKDSIEPEMDYEY